MAQTGREVGLGEAAVLRYIMGVQVVRVSHVVRDDAWGRVGHDDDDRQMEDMEGEVLEYPARLKYQERLSHVYLP